MTRHRARRVPSFALVLALVLTLAATFPQRIRGDEDASSSSQFLADYERALEALVERTSARAARDEISRLAAIAREAPTLEHLRGLGLVLGDGSSGRGGEYPRAYEEEIEDKEERGRWIAQREALYALSSLRRVGVIDDAALGLEVDEGTRSDDAAGASDGRWHRDALERSALMGDDWARTAYAYRLWKGFDGVETDPLRALTIMKEVAMVGLSHGPTTYELRAPTAAEWLRDRDRDAGWVSESLAAKATDQIALELDAAARGDNEAHAQLGYRALVGDQGVERNERAAFEHFVEAANRRGGGLPEVHYNLGFMYMNGMGTVQNYTAAREQFLKAISQGRIAPAYNGLGVLAFNGLADEKNYTEAKHYFEHAAKLNDPDGYFNLAQMYSVGHGVEANSTHGLELMEKASEHGHWRAPYELGMTYDLGVAVERNVSKATNYFHIFIEERFNWDKERNKAIESLIVQRNPWGALVRFALISGLGSEPAANNVVWLLRKSDAYTESDRFELAARMLREIIFCYESPEARVDLADLLSARKVAPDLSFDMIARYEHVEENASEHDVAAAGHLSVAAFAEDPYPEALVNLGWRHLFGTGVPVNATRSFELFAAGVEAAHDHHEAMPCIAATAISKVWLFAASTAKRMNFGTLGLPPQHFSSRHQAREIVGSASASGALRIIRFIDITERYVLICLTLALACVLGYRATLTFRPQL